MKIHLKFKQVDFAEILENIGSRSSLIKLIKYILSFGDGAAINFKLVHKKVRDELNKILQEKSINIGLNDISLSKKDDVLKLDAEISDIDYNYLLRILVDIVVDSINKNPEYKSTPEWNSFTGAAKGLPDYFLDKLSDKELDVIIRIIVNENKKSILTALNEEIKKRGFRFYASNIAIADDDKEQK